MTLHKATLHKVLIPVDNTEFSLGVLPHVTNLLDADRNELYLLHVARQPESIFLPNSGYEGNNFGVVHEEIAVYADQEAASIRENETAQLQPLIRSLEKMGYHVISDVAFGDPAEEIEHYVQAHDIDLVAMTTHGRQGLSRLLRGSVAQAVMHHLHVPVLLLREDSEDWFASDIGE